VDAFFVVYESLVFVLSLYDLKWARKCWSTRGMIGHTSAGPLRACVKVVDYCDPSSTGILTCAKSCLLRAFCHHVGTIRNSGLLSFILMRMIRSSSIASSHLINKANNKFKSRNLAAICNNAKSFNPSVKSISSKPLTPHVDVPKWP
jgi:hypothetical protein